MRRNLDGDNYHEYSGRRRKLKLKGLVQLAAVLILLLAMIGLSQLKNTATDNLLAKLSYYLTDSSSDQLQEVIAAFENGVWRDTIENGVLQTLGKLDDGGNNFMQPITIPVSGKIIRDYGWEEQPDGQKLLHPGVDISGLEPSAEVVAALSGNVRYIGKNERLGTYVELDHGQGVVTVYGNCQEIMVLEGQRVREGQVIARLKEERPYVHFELRVKGKPMDPLATVSDTETVYPQP